MNMQTVLMLLIFPFTNLIIPPLGQKLRITQDGKLRKTEDNKVRITED